MSPHPLLGADLAWPLWDDQPLEGAFKLDQHQDILDNAVVKAVERPWLFGYKSPNPNGQAILILGGGGYIELMAGREGVKVARWLTSLGFDSFVLVHRFPNAKTGSQAPLDDALRSLLVIEEKGFAKSGLGICGLSSGGHLAASLLASYPETWTSPSSASRVLPKFAIIGYGPISTNAVGRTIVANKASLEPPEKQELYNILQPDVQLIHSAPPTFIVYSGNDPIVPVVNAYRLAEGITKAGGTVELHVFADAPHGFGIDTEGLPVSKWPSLCEAWLEQNKLIEPKKE